MEKINKTKQQILYTIEKDDDCQYYVAAINDEVGGYEFLPTYMEEEEFSELKKTLIRLYTGDEYVFFDFSNVLVSDLDEVMEDFCPFYAPLKEAVAEEDTVQRYEDVTIKMTTPTATHDVVIGKRPIQRHHTHPFSYESILQFWEAPQAQTPYMKSQFRELTTAYGTHRFTLRMNNYMSNVQCKTGTTEYYQSWLFLTKRNRNDLLDKLKQPCIARAEAGVEQTDTVTQLENTTFTDQRETVVEEGYITQQTQPDMMKQTMPEDQWHVRNIMSKPIPFWSGDWSVSDTSGKILKTWLIPGDTMFGPHYNLLSTFTFFRGHPTIRIQANGTKFHSGRLIVAFIPGYQFGNYDDKLYTTAALQAMPHVIIDASMANSGVINLPFVHMNTYFNTLTERAWQSLGALIVAVFNPLTSATSSSQTIGITAWIHYDNCELHQPCYSHDVKLPKLNVAYAESRNGPRSSNNSIGSGLEGLMKSALPMVKDLITPEMSIIGDVIGGVANLDKPTDPVEITRWVPNAVTGLSTGEGIDRCSRLCLIPGSYTVGDADLISTTTDDMDLLELCKIPTRLTTPKWTDSENNGYQLLHMPVCPNMYSVGSVDDTTVPPVDVIAPTLLSYISRSFKYWRGNLRYKIQVVASQMHTGRLMISYGAGLNVSTSTFAKSSYLNTYIMDLQEKHEIEFEVPFMCERPWLRCDRMRKYNHLEGGSSDNVENVGYLDIHVLNRLSRPDSVSAAIEINVLVSAADSFELAVLSDLTAFQGIGTPIKTALSESLTTQETVSTRTETGNNTMAKGTQQLDSVAAATMSENAMNLKNLTRRYTKVYTLGGTVISDGCNVLSWANTPTLSGVNKCFNGYSTNSVQIRTPLCHFSELFAFWRGSLRYKVVFSITATASTTPAICNVTAYHVPGVYTPNFIPSTLNANTVAMYSALTALGTIAGSTGVQNSLEFEVPFYTPYTQLRTITGTQGNATSKTGTIILLFDTALYSKNSSIRVDLYQAAGDDFGLNYLRGAPRIQFVKGAEANRDVDDNAVGLYTTQPIICVAPSMTSDDETKIATAEGWTDNLPGVRKYNVAMDGIIDSTNGLKGVCDTASHLIQQAKKTVGMTGDDEEDKEATTDGASFLASITNPIQTVLGQILEILKTFPDTISGIFKPTQTTTDLMIEIANLVSGLSTFINGGIFQKACAIVTIVNTLLGNIASQMRNQLYHFAVKTLDIYYGSKKGNELPHAKAEANVLDLIAPLTASVTVAAGCLAFKKIPTDKETTDLCKGISEKFRLFNFGTLAISNLKTVWTWVRDLMEYVFDFIMDKLSPMYLAQLKLQREFEDVEQWAMFIDSLENIAYADRIHYDMDFKKKLFRAVDLGLKYNEYLLTGKIGREASVIREYVRKIMEIGRRCESSKHELPFRRDPFCVAMYGGTRIGKSGCITNMAFDVMDELKYPLHNRWCAINCTEKFFTENYRQQSAVYFDDFSTFTSEEQYQKFFNLKANTAYPLDMAFRKGEYFNSDFIFMTTNTPYPKPNFVTNHDALLARRDVLIECDWVESAEITAALANKENMANFRKLDNSHVRFRIHHSTEDQHVPGAWLSFQDMVKEVSMEAKAHLDRQQEKLNHDLQKAGYIPAQAESGPTRILNMDKLRKSPYFRLFDTGIFTEVVWDDKDRVFEMFTEDEYAQGHWKELQEYCVSMQVDLQKQLLLLSDLQCSSTSKIAKCRGMISNFKEYILGKIKTIEEEYPWISFFGKWAVIIATAIPVIYYGCGFVEAIVHKCLCAGISYYGFRCGLCGKWPYLKNIPETRMKWSMKEWAKVYGDAPYREGSYTTADEEFRLRKLLGTDDWPNKEMYYATAKAAQGSPYNADVTKGMKPTQVVANSVKVVESVEKGAKVVVANSGPTADLISTRVFPYIYRLRFDGNAERGPSSLNAYAIGDRKMLINKHFFLGMNEGDTFKVYHSGAWLPVVVAQDKVTILDKRDLIIYEMPVQFHSHKDNTHHFISEHELKYFQAGKGCLCKVTAQCTNELVDNLTITADKELNVNAEGTLIYVQDAWCYRSCTRVGDCGSVLVSNSSKLQGKILGLHCANDSTYSFSQLVTKEMLQNVVKRKNGTPVPKAEGLFGNLIPQGHFGRIGQCDKGQGFHQSGKTEIIPTEIHGMITAPVTGPSVLSPGDERLTKRVSPLREGIAKYGSVLVPFDEIHRKMINVAMADEVTNFSILRKPKVMTVEEAINGLPEYEGFERLPMNTSPGWPYTLTRPRGESGKAYLFDLNNNNRPLEPLLTKLDKRIEQAIRGERVESVWLDCLKDERRSLEKIAKGSTRVFTIPPVDFSIMMRMYTLDFCEAVKASRAYMDCKVGLDPQSLEWTILYKWLAEFSTLAIAGDFTRFDGNQPPDIMEDVKGDIDAFYEYYEECSEDDRTVRQILFDELIHTVQLAKTDFYMTHGGNPSGNPITVILNSRVNKRYMMLAWLGLARRLAEKKLRDAMENLHAFVCNVRCATYGDDNILMIKPEVADWFNQTTISEFLAEHGITYTNADKTGVDKVKQLKDCTFLKQSFADSESIKGVKVPHMAFNTIMELLNWTRVAPDQNLLLLDNCNDALRFSYFYGEHFFEQLRAKIIKALAHKDISHLGLLSYMDLHMWFLGTCGMIEGIRSSKNKLISV